MPQGDQTTRSLVADSAASAVNPSSSRPRERLALQAIRVLPVLLPLVIFVGSGLRGLDFGHHWDEPQHTQALHKSIDMLILLPKMYPYPSVSYFLTLAGLSPDVLTVLREERDIREIRLRLHSAVDGKPFLLRTRTIFLVVCSSGILFVYLLVLAWRGSVPGALLAASVLGLSWEIAYHSRWIAPDGVLMQFGALTAFGVVLAHKRPQQRGWLWLAATAAGLACGSKWPGGLLLVPVLMVGIHGLSGRGPTQKFWLGVKIVFVFGAVYLFTTPGTVLDPGRMFDAWLTQKQI